MENNIINWNKSILLSGIVIYVIYILIEYYVLGHLMMPISWVLLSCLIVAFFFIGSFVFFKNTQYLGAKQYVRKLVVFNFIIKLIFMTVNYFYYKSIYGIAILGSSDHLEYYRGALELSEYFRNLDFSLNSIISFPLSDRGAYIYYAVIYAIFGDRIFIASFINVIFAIHTIVLFYKTIRIINSEHIARLSAIIISLIPILNYYVGNHLKETFFLWLIILGTYQLIYIFEKNKFILYRFIITLIVVFSLFLFRTVVALSFIGSIGIYIIAVRDIKLTYKIAAIIITTFSILIYSTISSINDETDKYYVKYNGQPNNSPAYKLKKKRGRTSVVNEFMGLPYQAVLAVIGPLPTIIDKSKTKNYGETIGLREKVPDAIIKAFLSFFFLLGLVKLKNITSNYFFSAFVFSNLFVVSISGHALMYRFLIPVMPFFIYFSVLGLVSKNKLKKFYYLYMFVIIIIYYVFNETKLIDFHLIY